MSFELPRNIAAHLEKREEMVIEALYTVLGGASCYTLYHLVQAFRNGEFQKRSYDRPPVFLPQNRFGRRDDR